MKLVLPVRAQAAALRAVYRLPRRVLALLAAPAVEVEGMRLDPEMRLLLRLQRIEGPEAARLPIDEGRRTIVRSARLAGGEQPVGDVRDLSIDSPEGHRLRLRAYTPARQTTDAAVLFLHGGGFVYGDLDSHDALCRRLCEGAGVPVVAVDYRLAPEHPFPAAVDDAIAGYRWLLDHAADLGADPARLAVCGDSAGGNLATVVAQHALAAGLVPPVFQLLIYPVTDFTTERDSRRTFADGFYLSTAFRDLADRCYTAGSADRADPRLSPLQGTLTGLPPAHVVTAGFDPLRDEGLAYAEAMRAAGVEVDYRCEEALIHSFANMLVIGRSAPAGIDRIVGSLRRGLLSADIPRS